MLGKEAGLFCASGTMANQVAIMTHTRPGNEVIVGKPSHIVDHEVGASAILSSVTLVTIDAPTGFLTPERIEAEIRGPDIHHPETGLICLESAHSSGAVQSLESMQAVRKIADRHGLPLYLDGARIFNAAHALGVDAKVVAECADSVMFCLSKGLAAPIGSVLCGPHDFIERARKNRKILGGGMRQVGLLGAAGLYALEHNVERLAEDHARARRLAEALRAIPRVSVQEERLDIDMVWFRLDTDRPDDEIVQALREREVVVYPSMAGEWRLVAHKDIDDEDLDFAIGHLSAVLG
jgi:threonine aldolase